MLTVGDRFPEFNLKAVIGLEQGHEFQDLNHESFPGKPG